MRITRTRLSRQRSPRGRFEVLDSRLLLAADVRVSLYEPGQIDFGSANGQPVEAGNRDPLLLRTSPMVGDGDDGKDGIPDPREADLPILHSNPAAPKKIFLDFDGHVVSGTPWNQNNNNQPIHAPPYSIDSNILALSQSEANNIMEIFHRVAEDFSPFNVDVTTEDPGPAAFVAGSQAIRCLISTDVDEVQVGGSGNRWFSGAGGVAFLNSWTWTDGSPVWVFENNLGNGNPKYVGEASSHEVGHALNLSHDGLTSGQSYYGGHGSGQTGWAPIMGVGYDRNLTQWSRGEYTGANQAQNDLNIIAGKLPYRTDDHSNNKTNAGLATALQVSGMSVSGSGLISQTADVDVFRFEVGQASALSLTVSPYFVGPNLDILAEIYNGTGQLVASANPLNVLAASFSNLALDPGTYTLAIDGVGQGTPATGYSDYASLGQYTIAGSLGPYDPSPGGPFVTAPPTLNQLETPSSLTYVFNEAINPSSFSLADDFRLLEGGSNDLSGLLTGYGFVDDHTLRIDFSPLNFPGNFQAQLGPHIADSAGNLMDQDRDGIRGEDPADKYVYSFALSLPGGPRVTGPATLDNPTVPSSITFTFSEALQPASFDLYEDFKLRDGQGTDLFGLLTGHSFPTANSIQVNFLPIVFAGQFSAEIGPDVLDVTGNAMDQDQDGTYGENPADRYTFQFTVGQAIVGDFNNDQVVDDRDIDLLCAAIRSGDSNPTYDLTGDTFVDMADMDMMIRDVLDTEYGDANLDRSVDGSDFNLWNAHKFGPGGWRDGDFSCDGSVDGSDFNVWNSFKFSGSGRGVPASPSWLTMDNDRSERQALTEPGQNVPSTSPWVLPSVPSRPSPLVRPLVIHGSGTRLHPTKVAIDRVLALWS